LHHTLLTIACYNNLCCNSTKVFEKEKVMTFASLGVALMTHELGPHLDWLASGKRDLELQDFCQYELLDGDWQIVLSRAREMLEGYPGRMGIHGPFWGLNLANPDPCVRDVVKRRLEHGLTIAGELGATHMVIHSPIDPWLHRHILNNKEERDYVMATVADTLGELCKKASSIGCELVMENIMDLDPRLQLDLIKSVNSDVLKISIDVGHAFCMHTQHGAPPPDQFIAEAGSYLAHVHLQDTDGYLDRHWLPGEGQVNFKAIFEEIAKTGTQPRLIIEVKDKARCQETAAWLGQYAG
jgi:sugar phosphate isomerase/epimerase